MSKHLRPRGMYTAIVISFLTVFAQAQNGGPAHAHNGPPITIDNTSQLKAAAEQAMGLTASTLFTIDEALTTGENIVVEVPIDGQLQVVQLEPHSVRAPNFELLVQQADGSIVSVDPGPDNTYRGNVITIGRSRVAGSLMDDGVHLMIQLFDARRFFVEPLHRRVEGANATDYIIYEDQHVAPCGGECGNDFQDQDDHKQISERQSFGAGTACVAEMGADTDYEYYVNSGSTVDGTADRISNIINTVNVQYESQVGITHLLTVILVRNNPADPYTETDSTDLLCEFIEEWTNNHSDIDRDVAELFTGKDLNGGVIGQAADIGDMCDNNGSCGLFNSTDGSYCIAQDLNIFSCDTDLTAHELGHLWDASHCNCPSFTMNPSIGCNNQFSQGSIDSITAYADTLSCLDGSCDIGGNPTCPGTGDCCEDTNTPGCDDADCCETVCACDPYCCDTEWDEFCSGQGFQGNGCGAELLCGSLCTDGGCQNNGDCNDGVSCTVDTCNVGTGECTNTPSNALCDNGQYCDGIETCNAQTGCVDGPDVNCNDGISCTADSCNESSDSCDHDPNDALCDNGQYCDGAEFCSTQSGCLDGANPNCNDGDSCTIDSCNESTDSCDHTPDPGCSNDDCSGASVIGEGSFPFDTTDATTDGPPLPESCDEGFGLSLVQDRWAEYIAGCTGTATVSLCDSDYDTRMAFYNDGNCPGSIITCNDDACGTGGLRSEDTFSVTEGSSYLLRIGGYSTGGTGTMVVTCEDDQSTSCTGDTSGDDIVDTVDLLEMLGAWGPCAGCPSDLNENGVVDTADLLIMLGAWGPCP